MTYNASICCQECFCPFPLTSSGCQTRSLGAAFTLLPLSKCCDRARVGRKEGEARLKPATRCYTMAGPGVVGRVHHNVNFGEPTGNDRTERRGRPSASGPPAFAPVILLYGAWLVAQTRRSAKQQSRSNPQRNEESIQDRYLDILLPSNHRDHGDQRLSERGRKQRACHALRPAAAR
jgi:hypothetical protein